MIYEGESLEQKNDNIYDREFIHMNKKLVLVTVLTGSLILGTTACSNSSELITGGSPSSSVTESSKKQPLPEGNITVTRAGNKVVLESEEFELAPDNKDGICNSTLFIKDELLYVSIFDKAGKEACYKTQIHADGLFLILPKENEGGTVETACILRGNRVIYMFSHSYIDEPITKDDIEAIFGEVSIVE